MKISNLAVVFAAGLLIGGCGAPAFSPKPLNAEARGITEVRSIPYGCKSLGEFEGSDEVSGYGFAALRHVREGALNDIRNKAFYIIGDGKRKILYILSEKGLCYGEQVCPPESVYVHSYHVRAQIFDCGEKYEGR